MPFCLLLFVDSLYSCTIVTWNTLYLCKFFRHSFERADIHSFKMYLLSLFILVIGCSYISTVASSHIVHDETDFAPLIQLPSQVHELRTQQGSQNGTVQRRAFSKLNVWPNNEVTFCMDPQLPLQEQHDPRTGLQQAWTGPNGWLSQCLKFFNLSEGSVQDCRYDLATLFVTRSSGTAQSTVGFQQQPGQNPRLELKAFPANPHAILPFLGVSAPDVWFHSCAHELGHVRGLLHERQWPDIYTQEQNVIGSAPSAQIQVNVAAYPGIDQYRQQSHSLGISPKGN